MTTGGKMTTGGMGMTHGVSYTYIGHDGRLPNLRTLDQREAEDVATLHRRLEALEAIVRRLVLVQQADKADAQRQMHAHQQIVYSRLSEVEAIVAELTGQTGKAENV